MNRTMISLFAFIPLTLVLGCATGPMPDENAPRVYGGSISHPNAAPYQYGEAAAFDETEYETIVVEDGNQSVLQVIDDATADLSGEPKPEEVQAEPVE